MADYFKKKDIAIIGLLISIEQFIKIIVNTFFFENQIMFLDGMFGFKPYLNTTQLSFFNNELGMNVGLSVLIFLNIILLPIIPLSIYLLFKKEKVHKVIYLAHDFVFAAMICSLIDKVFWGGSLDYIYLFNRWIVDLKDIYFVLALVGVFYCGLENEIRKRK